MTPPPGGPGGLGGPGGPAPSAEDTDEEPKKKRYCSLREAMRFYNHYFFPYRGGTAWALFLHLMDLVPFTLLPLVTMVIVDYFIPARNVPAIGWSMVAVMVLVFFNLYFHCGSRIQLFRMLTSVSRDLRNHIVQRLQVLSLSYHNKNPTGRYYSKIMTDVDNLQNFASIMVMEGGNVFGGLVITIAILSFINLKVLLLSLIFIPIFQVVVYVFKERMQRTRNRARCARDNLSSIIGNFLQSSLLARMHGHENFESNKVNTGSEQVIKSTIEAEAAVTGFMVANIFGMHLINYGVMALCAVFVIDGSLSFGEMLLFNNFINRIVQQVSSLLNMLPQIVVFTESVASIKEITDAPDIEYNHGKRRINNIQGRITFDNVTFTYEQGTRPVLRDVTLNIEPGVSVGLVGKSGSGKSTFVNLALGLYRTKEGVVSIDGMPVDSLDMRTVRKHVGVVSQNPVLFSGTIHENIVHAYGDTPFEKVIEAAKMANAHDFIIRLPKGYDTQVGEQGVLLSGGQKQRIALARTILREPKILVLDEATSALDSESEHLVQNAIDNLNIKMTKLVIAHRLSTIRKADIILVFENGQIVEQGSHQELVEQCGVYAGLLAYQSMNPDESADALSNTLVVTR